MMGVLFFLIFLSYAKSYIGKIKLVGTIGTFSIRIFLLFKFSTYIHTIIVQILLFLFNSGSNYIFRLFIIWLLLNNCMIIS